MKLKSFIKVNCLYKITSALAIENINFIKLSKMHLNHSDIHDLQTNILNNKNTLNSYNNHRIFSSSNLTYNSSRSRKILLNASIKNNYNYILNRNLSYFSFSTNDDSPQNNYNNKNNEKNSTTNKSSKNTVSSADSLSREELEKIKNIKLANKLDTVFKNELNDKVKNKNEYEFCLNKMRPFNDFYKYLRYPAFAILIPMPWLNPFSTAYSMTLIASNYYMILLTLLESSVFFAAGLTYYMVTIKNYSFEKYLVSLRDKRNFKRMSVAFLHFSLIMLSAVLASSYSNQYSLILLLLGNAFLYAKYSYHILLRLFPKELFEQRMLMIFINCALCVAFLVIISWKKYLHKMIA